MSDDEQDYNIENSDAGASATIPCAAGEVKKGGYLMVKGKPTKVLSISVSKTGKHGHAKCNFLVVDIFTSKKLEDMVPSTHGVMVPIVNRNEWNILNIDEEDFLSLTNDAGDMKEDLKLPEVPETMAQEIRDLWADGDNEVIVTVQAAVGQEQVVSFKKV